LSRTMTGENSLTWRGGYEPYYGPSWPAAKRAARRRDPVCQHCGLTREQNGKALDVHHIVPFPAFGVARHEEANALHNLRVLCPPCHLRTEWETDQMHHTEKAPADAWPVRGPKQPKPIRYCAQCGAPLAASRPPTAQFCSMACRGLSRVLPRVT